MIIDAEDLKNFFWFCGLQHGPHSVNVTTKVRKEFLLNNHSNTVVVNCGRVEEVKWKNMGGGVWQATVEVKETK